MTDKGYPTELTPEQQAEIDRMLTPEKRAELQRQREWYKNLTAEQKQVIRNSARTVEWFFYAVAGTAISAAAVLALNLFGFAASWWIPGGMAVLAALIFAGGKAYEVTARKRAGLNQGGNSQ